MNISKSLYTLILFILFSGYPTIQLRAQELTQTVRGRITDADSKMGIPGVNIVILHSDPFKGAPTDNEGYFKIANVPVGRISLKITSLGFEERIVPNLLILSGKETVLDIELRESFLGMSEVVITAGEDKSAIVNEMALVSARGFTIEETKRYAGAINDPARMVASYAGVNSDGAGNNDIIVRGNNPRNIQWRLEDVEIPNPNHFAQEGMTGGPISALNSQMLTNSEFYTGAFAPQYGNALAGIFDMKLRKGNNEKHERSLSLGILGTDVTLEGPFQKGKKSSYLVNYRYSTLGLLERIGVVDFQGVPEYQDLSFKFFMPTKKLGTLSVFGLGGKSNMLLRDYDKEIPEKLLEKMNLSSDLAIAGISQYLPLGKNLFLQNTVSYSMNGSGFRSDQPDDENSFKELQNTTLENKTLRISSDVNLKWNTRNQIQMGVIYSRYTYDLNSRYFDIPSQTTQVNQSQFGNADLLQGFASWRWRITEKLTLVNGIHSQKTSLNENVSFEPRSSFRWDVGNNQAVTGGFGLHSKMTSLPNHFALVYTGAGDATIPNRNLDFSKARHYVIGYENKLGENLFLKIETYYQDLYNIPIEDNPASSYSLINQDEIFTDRALVNEGKGKNYGLELTLERYFKDSYYFLLTGSLFDSKYIAGDKIWRNTRFNGNYMGNFLFGKEFPLPSQTGKNKVLGVNTRTALLGGRRILPIDVEASKVAGKAIYHELNAFEQKNNDIFTFNLGLVYRIDKRKTSQEIKLDIQNLTGNSAVADYFWNPVTEKVEEIPQLPTLPVLSYTINF